MSLNSRFAGRPWFLLYVVFSLIAIFYLPYLVPQQPSTALSYIFGYNLRVGVVLLLLLTAVGATWTKGLDLQFSARGLSQPVPLKALAVSLLAVLFGCVALYLLVGRVGGFAESGYGIDRTWLLSIGRTPYIDFEFPYGPSFLYLPLFFQRLLPITIAQSFYLVWVLNYLLGTVVLFKVVNMIDYPTGSKLTIFLLLFGAGFLSIIFMSASYTFLRYTCPLFFILVIQGIFKGGDFKRRVHAALLSFAFTGILLLISPEIAIAHAFACTCIFLIPSPSQDTHRNRWTLLAGLLFAFAVLFWAALKFHMLDFARAAGGGANGVPLSFGPHILLFFAALFVCACYVFRRFSVPGINDNTIGLVAFSMPMVAAALAKCEIFHVFWNGEGIFLASMFYVSNYKGAWKWYKAAFVVIMILLTAVVEKQLYTGAFGRAGINYIGQISRNSRVNRYVAWFGRKYYAALGDASHRAKWEASLANARELSAADGIDLARLYPSWHGTFLAPLGYQPDGIGTYSSDRIDPGYYEGYENASTVTAIDHKIAEIENHAKQALLLPEGFQNSCNIDANGARSAASIFLAFPYFGKAVHLQSVRRPFCAFILANYTLEEEPSPQNYGYGLWVAKSAEGLR